MLREVQNVLTITSSTTLVQYGALSFQLSDLANYSSWTAVFDRYRVRSVRVTFNQRALQLNTSPNAFNAPRFATVIDYDDATAPTSFAQLDKYSTYAGVTSTNNLVRHFVPRASRPVYISGVSTGYQESDPDAWNDCAYPSIPHFGIKYALDTSIYAASSVYEVLAEFLIELSGQRG